MTPLAREARAVLSKGGKKEGSQRVFLFVEVASMEEGSQAMESPDAAPQVRVLSPAQEVGVLRVRSEREAPLEKAFPQ